MNTTHAIAIAAALLSSAAFAQSTGKDYTDYWSIGQSFGTASAGPVAPTTSVSSGFESSWLHLRESHGVGLAAAESASAFVGTGAHCDTSPVANHESSLLALLEARGTGDVPASRMAGSTGTSC